MKTYFCSLLLFVMIILGSSSVILAATSDEVTVVPNSLSLVRTLPGDSVAASMRLNVNHSISNVTLLVSDLQGVGNNDELLDPIPASNINILPALQFNSLAANSITQLTLQLAPPATVGVYTGTLLIRWEDPDLNEIVVPIRLLLRTKPELVIHDPGDAAGIQIYSARGTWLSESIQERQIILRENSRGAAISELQAFTPDLLDNVNHQSLSSDLLSIKLASSDIAPGRLSTATLAVDLTNAPAGAFNGNLTITGKPNILVTVSIAIMVRHHWYLPFIFVTCGVLLGLSLSTYQARGRLRDEFVVRIANLRESLKEDIDLKKNFGDRLEQMLVDVDIAMRTARWRTAESKMSEAENLVTKWRKDAEDWKNQLDYLRVYLLKRLETKQSKYPDPNVVPQAVRELRQNAEDLLKSAADCESPIELRNKIALFEEKIHAFDRVEEALQELSTLRMEFDVTKVEAGLMTEWLQTEDSLRAKLSSVYPEPEPLNALKTEIVTQKQVLSQYRQTHLDHLVLQPAATPNSAEAETDEDHQLYLPGVASSQAFDPNKARRRLVQNAWLLYILSAIVLIAVGMSTLYAPNATFGANALSDYFSIFIFGLGAQTTVASATDLLQRWGLPFAK